MSNFTLTPVINTNSTKLTTIGMKYQTDKAYFHLFTEFYNDYFQKVIDANVDRPINILGIGIDKGASLLMYKDFFPSTTNIHAIDININSVDLQLGDNIHTYLCSQDNFELLALLFNETKFDIIIDDGSHLTSHQQSSLGFFFPYLKKNGIYVCEDLHTSYNKNYIDTHITTMDMIEHYQKYKTVKSHVMNDNQIDYLNTNILGLDVYERRENALMCYNCKMNNYENKNTCKTCNTILSPLDKSITSIFTHK